MGHLSPSSETLARDIWLGCQVYWINDANVNTLYYLINTQINETRGHTPLSTDYEVCKGENVLGSYIDMQICIYAGTGITTTAKTLVGPA